PGTISVQVLEGFIEFTTAQRTVELAAGQMLALHKKIPHSLLAKEESTFLLSLALSEAERVELPANTDESPKSLVKRVLLIKQFLRSSSLFRVLSCFEYTKALKGIVDTK